MDQQPEAINSAGHGGFVKPWLWLGFALFTATLGALLYLEVAAGESIRAIDFRAELFQAALAGSALTGLVWIFRALRQRDESEGKPVLFMVSLAGALGLILFTLLFYTVENYRGKRAWLTCWHTSLARGERLTLAEHAPSTVPDDENFAMQPIWVEEVTAQLGTEKARTWYGDRVNAYNKTNAARPLELPVEMYSVLEMTNRPGNWLLAEKTDLGPWQNYYRQLAQRTNYFPIASEPQSPAEDVLLALSRSSNRIEQLRAASALPYARFPMDYTNENPAVILLPHLTMLKGAVQFLRLRASTELQAGRTASALEDIKLMLRLNDLLRDEPLLISHLVHIAMFQIEIQPIWEGLAEQSWNDTQLAQMDTWLAQSDFLKCYTNAMAGEKAYGCQVISYLERNRRQIGDLIGLPSSLPQSLRENETLMNCIAIAIPRGWFDQNKATIWQFYDEHLDHLIDTSQRTYSSSNAIQLTKAESQLGSNRSPYNGFAGILLPAVDKAAKKAALAQQLLDFVRIAIALERYRLANGQFPEKLKALTPAFLAQIPHDIITGEPLKYHPTENGSFVLYSLGWNETDDGGKVGLTITGRPDPESGDWVWRYPESKK